MGAGLLQLIATGGLNNDIIHPSSSSYDSTDNINNPCISFFYYVSRKHTNFAVENFILPFDTIPSLLTNMHITSDYSVNLKSLADVDLLSHLYLIFKLPAIYSSDVYKFKWVENIGSLVIKKASIVINNTIIDTITGEWLIIWNELTMPVKDGYNDMVGNVPALNNPRKPETTIRIRNNIINDYDYLASDGIKPSINERDVYVPLKFWFSKNLSLALPIIRIMTKNSIYLKIEFENIEKLYTVYSDIYNMNISPYFYNLMHNSNINITNFIKQNTFNAHIEATYIVLDTRERREILNKVSIEYLIEKVSFSSDQFPVSNVQTIKNININSQLGVKEIIWTLKRGDSLDNFNDTFNYTYSIPKNSEKSIMKNAKLIWDRNASGNPFFRVEEKDSYFYNKIQPYQYHSAIPMQGIYLYSFSLYPEKWFSSGFYNGSSVKTILSMTFNSYENNYIDTIYTKKNYNNGSNKNIYCNIYTIEYDVLILMNGQINLKYAN